MKKSKILVPAVALLALSTAAATTGTVAWFTTNNSVSAATMTAHVNDLKDLRISVTSSDSWKVALTSPTDAWIDKTTSGGLSVAYTGELTSPTDVFTAANAPKEAEATALNFAKPAERNTIDPVTGAANTAFEANKDMSTAYVASSEYTHGAYKLLYAGAKDSEIVTTTVTIGSTTSKNIDSTLVVAVLVNQANVYTYKLPAYSSGYAAITGPEITLTKSQSKRVDVYIWYDGTNGQAKNENAVNNPLSFSLSHAFKPAA